MDVAACRLENGAHEGDSRALAVGARHVNHRGEVVLRPSEIVKQPFDPVETEIDQLVGVKIKDAP